MRDIDALIDRSNAAYSARFSQALLDRMMFVGDPLADRAVASLHERQGRCGSMRLANGGELGGAVFELRLP